MTREKLKVLEMVAEGKISPEEGVRLIEALGSANRAAGRGPGRVLPIDVGDIRLPKIDLGKLGEVCVEVKKTVSEGARKAHRQIKKSKAIEGSRLGRFLDMRDFPLSVDRSETMESCKVKFDISAGKLKVKGQEIGDKLLLGKVKRSPEEPVIITEESDGKGHVTLRHSIGRCLLRMSPEMPYSIKLDNSAADSRLQLDQLQISEMDIDNNAGSIMAVMGARVDRVNLSISNNAGSVLLKLPSLHAVRIRSTGSLSTDNLEKLGLETVDGCATSSDWDENPKRFDIELSQNVANFKLDWKRSDGVTIGDDEADGEKTEVYDFKDMDDDQDDL